MAAMGFSLNADCPECDSQSTSITDPAPLPGLDPVTGVPIVPAPTGDISSVPDVLMGAPSLPAPSPCGGGVVGCDGAGSVNLGGGQPGTSQGWMGALTGLSTAGLSIFRAVTGAPATGIQSANQSAALAAQQAAARQQQNMLLIVVLIGAAAVLLLGKKRRE